MNIYTSYFAKQKKMELEDAAYVSIAVGNPKYAVPYTIVNARILKPYGVSFKLSFEEFKRQYIQRLEKYGVDEIRKEIIDTAGGHRNVILMCHEKDENTCHRRMFAEWWESKTGERIEEYGKVTEKKRERKQVEQLSILSMLI